MARKPIDLSSVTFLGDTITIKFQLLDGALRAMLDYRIGSISPIATGKFRDAWFISVNGVPFTDFTKQIPHNSTVIMTNFAPYARRLEEQGRLGRSGRLRSYARPEYAVTVRTQQWAQQQFPGTLIERIFVVIPGGGSARGWQVPYVLKRGPHQGEIDKLPGPANYRALRCPVPTTAKTSRLG